MKAPENIYIQPDAQDGWFMVNNPNNTLVKYTRTDAFIEKAIEWISNNCYIPHATLEDFRKYMEGE